MRSTHEEFTISLVSHLSAEENRAKIAEHGLEDNVLLQRDWEVAETYGTETTPSAVLIPTLAHCQFATIAVLTVLAYFLIQQLADNIPHPRIQGHALQEHDATTLRSSPEA
jgi:hypothetical protein